MTRRASSTRLSDSKVRKRISTSVRRHKDTTGDNYLGCFFLSKFWKFFIFSKSLKVPFLQQNHPWYYLIDPFLRPPMCLLLICIPGAVFMLATLKQANFLNPDRIEFGSLLWLFVFFVVALLNSSIHSTHLGLLILFIVLIIIGIAWLITANHERKSLRRKLLAKKLFEVSLNLRKHQASVKVSLNWKKTFFEKVFLATKPRTTRTKSKIEYRVNIGQWWWDNRLWWRVVARWWRWADWKNWKMFTDKWCPDNGRSDTKVPLLTWRYSDWQSQTTGVLPWSAAKLRPNSWTGRQAARYKHKQLSINCINRIW